MFWAFNLSVDVPILALFGHFFQKLGEILFNIWSHCIADFLIRRQGLWRIQ
jgi:hypothetical protein